MSRILVIEDEVIIRSELKRVLTREGYDVVDVGDVPSAREAMPESFDLILSDLRLPGPRGDVLLNEVKDVPIILMTAFGTVSSAVDAMKRGALDYLSKPIDPDELLLIIRRALEQRQREQAHLNLRREVDQQWQVFDMIGSSQPMQQVFQTINRVAPTDTTVLVLGETGTGKELVARAIHARSKRAQNTFVAVNCASVPDGLIESELFGHEKGAFTGATIARKGLIQAAHQGTLFLDEIGELPLPAQARLLRVLQEGEVRRVGANHPQRVDIRLLAATHRNLPQMVEEGTFRRDLFFRLKVLEIKLPALREREDDILLLADSVLKELTRELPVHQPVTFASETLRLMQRHSWPGNVRELRNAIERAVILHQDGSPIGPSLLGLSMEEEAPAPQSVTRTVTTSTQENASLGDYFIRFVTENQSSMNETELAKHLGISRKTLWERRKKLGIPRPKK